MGAIAWMGLNILFANVLSVEEFGLFSFCMSATVLLGTVGCFGYGQVLMRDGSQASPSGSQQLFRDILATGRATVLWVSLIIVLVLVSGYSARLPVPVFEHGLGILMTVAASVPLYSYMLLHREGLRADGQLFMALIGFNLLRPIIPIGIFSGILMFGIPDVVLAMWTWVIGLLAILVADIIRLYPTAWIIWPRRQTGVASFRQASILWLSEFSNVVLLQAPILVAGIVLDLRAAALLFAAHRLGTQALFGIDGMRIAVAPQIARSFRLTAAEQYQVFGQASVLWAFSGLLFAVPVGLFAAPLLGLFGEEFVEASAALVIISVGRLFQALVGPTGAVMQYGRMEHLRGALTFVAAAAQIIVTLSFGAAIGIVGIAWTMTLSIIALETASVVVIRKRTGIWLGIGSLIQDPSLLRPATDRLIALLNRWKK
jgi:O-antigen/teichoic acid export membrane protein